MNHDNTPDANTPTARRTHTPTRAALLAIAVTGLMLLTSTPAASLTTTTTLDDRTAGFEDELAATCAIGVRAACDATDEKSDAETRHTAGLEEKTRDVEDKLGDDKTKPIVPKKKDTDEDGSAKDDKGPGGPPHANIPRGFPGYYQPPATGEVFLPDEYYVICVPRAGDTTDHFVVDADSLRILEFVSGDVKLSEHGFIVATCELPWDLPWPAPPA